MADTQGQKTPETEVSQVKTEVAAVKEEKATVKGDSYTKEQFAKMQGTFEKKAKASEREAQLAKQESDNAKAEFAAMQKKIAALEEMEDRKLEETLGGDDMGRKLLALKRELAIQEREVARRSKLAEEQYRAGEWGLKMKEAIRISKEYGIDDPEELMDANTPDAMELKALKLDREKSKQGKIKPKAQEEEEEPEDLAPKKIDSGISNVAGKPILTLQEFAKRLDEASAKRDLGAIQELNLAKREGRVKYT